MFHFGWGYLRPGKACEMLALGDDPLHFTKSSGVLIDVGLSGSIDETHAHKPSVIYHGGMLYHFYCAVSGKYPNEVHGIAVARSRPWYPRKGTRRSASPVYAVFGRRSE